MNDLLERAKSIQQEGAMKRKAHAAAIPDDDKIALALAWINGEIGLRAINLAVGKKNSSSTSPYVLLATGLRCAYSRGLIVLVESDDA